MAVGLNGVPKWDQSVTVVRNQEGRAKVEG